MTVRECSRPKWPGPWADSGWRHDMLSSRAMRRFAFVLLVAVVSCGSDPVAAPTSATSLFSTDADLTEAKFFDHPFPSDVRRDADGKAVFTGFPNPQLIPLIVQYLKATEGLLDGFSPAAPVYLRFSAPIDPAALPADPPATLATDAVGAARRRRPELAREGQATLGRDPLAGAVSEGVYWQPNTLAVMPMLGRPLRPKTRYAVVVTTLRVKEAEIAPSADLEEVLGLRDRDARHREGAARSSRRRSPSSRARASRRRTSSTSPSSRRTIRRRRCSPSPTT